MASTDHSKGRLLRRLLWPLCFAAASAAGLCLAVMEPAHLAAEVTGPPPKHIVIFLIDALRPDFLGCYGGRRGTSPNIDEFAAESVVFENAWSNANWTKPAVASLFTGLWASETRTLKMVTTLPDGAEVETSLPEGLDTLAETLAAAGYRTAAFANNPHIDALFGFDRGFEVYRQGAFSCDELVAMFLEWRASLGPGEPSFAYIHVLEPHAPYEPRAPYDDMFGGHEAASRIFGDNAGFEAWAEYRDEVNAGNIVPAPSAIESFRNLYCGEVAWTDAAFARLLQALKADGTYDDTLLVLTADHGENFYENGVLGHPPITCWQGQVGIPLVMRYPAGWGVAPRRVRGTAQLFDVTATVSAAAVRRPLGRGIDLAGCSAAGRVPPRVAICEGVNRFVALVGTLKVHARVPEEGEFHISRIFRIAGDPREKLNILEDKPSFSSWFGARAEKWHRFVEARGEANTAGARTPEISDELRLRMRALGYLN